MTQKKEWEEFFDGFAPVYMKESFTRNTIYEVDFLIEELKLEAGSRILDIGCGTGRHSVELARRGYLMTGVDMSSGMLAEAGKAALDAGVRLELIHCDAALFKSDKKYDAAICLCEGAFALLGRDDDPLTRDLAILQNINAALKPGARFILTTLNAMEKIRKYSDDDVRAGKFNQETIVETIPMEYDTARGKKSVTLREKGYIVSELRLLLHLAGFEIVNIWGGTAGSWNRQPLRLDEIEIMAVAAKSG